MMRFSEIEGLEFDWFAVDQDGCVALFATAGYGDLPEPVFNTIEAHADISHSFHINGWGSEDVWQSYANLGLYVYDWSDSQKCYIQLLDPNSPIHANLFKAISSIPDLPYFKLSFAKVKKITAALFDSQIKK